MSGVFNDFLSGLGLTTSDADQWSALQPYKDTNDAGGAALRRQLQNGYYDQANNDYAQQQGGVDMLRQAALGQVPSAAQLQMQRGLQQANSGIQSAALSQQNGLAPGLTQRNMLSAQANAAQNIVGQGGALRAQEQAAARDAYTQALNGMRGQSIQQGTMGGQLDQSNIGMQSALAGNTFGALTGQQQSSVDNTRYGLTALGQMAQSGAKTLAGGATPAVGR